MQVATDIVHLGWAHAAALGLLQGLTEFLPVSSTAHMDIAMQALKLEDSTHSGAAFSAIVQLGPIIAIIAYFRRDLARYASGILRTRTPMAIPADDLDARLGWFTLVGTLPLAVFGVLLEHQVDTHFRRLVVVAVSLVLLGLILWAAEIFGRRNRGLGDMTWRDCAAIGGAQALALVPGASRSGVTITAGLFRGLDRESAARFSFLLSIPAITAAGLYKLIKVLRGARLGHDAATYLFAAVIAGLVAYAVVRWFLGFMKEHNTAPFIIYRILLGLTLLVMLSQGVLRDPRLQPEPTKVVPSARNAPVKLVLPPGLRQAAFNRT